MISGISSSLYQSQITQQFQQMKTTFQQLGADLQSGNVAAAQKDFATLTGNSSNGSTGTTSEKSSLQQEIQQLGQDLQSGNLSAAQQDYTQIQQSAQQEQTKHHGHHGHHASSTPSDTSNDPLSLFTNLATTAASAYGGGGVALAAGSMLSQLV